MLVRGACGVERSGWRCVAALALVASGGAHASTADAAPTAEHAGPYEWRLPPGFPTPAVPADNPMSAEKVALGQRLFFEPRLSVTGRYSCSSCHDPARAFTDGRAVAVGATGQTLTRSAMSLVNAAYNISFGWTKAEVLSLEQQMLEPLLNQHPVEMGLAGREAEVSSMLAADPQYSAEFAAAFPRVAETGAAAIEPRTANADAAVTFDRIVKAIAAFERTLIGGNSPFDRYVFRGEHDALSAQEKRGMELFYSPRAGCGACHSGFNFSGNWRDSQGVTGESVFANNGVGNQPMRVPTLRNIALTAPYMHDGRFATLEAVLDHYASVAQQPASDPKLRTFNLSPDERADVIAFLHALTDSAGR